MIDQAAVEAIEDVLDALVAGREMFTAFDVAKEVQARLKAENKFIFEQHRHLAMKDYIHDQCDAELDHSWNRTLIKIKNVNTRPYLYYPVEKDPANYVTKFPAEPKNAAPNAPFPGQQFQVVGPATAAVKVPGTCVFNSADYLHVPRRIVRNMGLAPGDTMHVVQDADGVALVKDLNPNQTSLKDVNVDNRNYVRMKRAVIAALGLDGTAFTITEDAGKITIRVQADPAPGVVN